MRKKNVLSMVLGVVSLGSCVASGGCSPSNGSSANSAHDASVSSDGDDGSGNSDAGTGPSCAEDERSIDGKCTQVPMAVVSLGTMTRRDAKGQTSQFTYQNQVCFYQPAPPSAPSKSTDVGDGCTLSEGQLGGSASGGNSTFRGDIGTVTIRGAHAGTNILTADPTRDCYRSSLPATAQVFTDGDSLTIDAAGGKDFPAFSATLAVPPAVVLSTSPYVRGQNLALSWTGTSSQTISITISSSTTTGYATLSCSVPDTGSHTISGALTAKLLPAATTFVSLERMRVAPVEPAEQVVILVNAMTGDSLPLH